jgi:hypothetical protein
MALARRGSRLLPRAACMFAAGVRATPPPLPHRVASALPQAAAAGAVSAPASTRVRRRAPHARAPAALA